MSDLSELRHRIAALEQLAATQANHINMMAQLVHNTATAVNRNADICTSNFEKIAAANNSLAQAIAKPDESDWWKRGGDNDGEGDTGVPAP